MATDHLLVERRGGVLYVTMNRPDKLNALSNEMMDTMPEELARAAHDPEVGAVVLTGAGRGFCAGGDIGGMREGPQSSVAPVFEESVARLRRWEESSALLHEMPKVTIAAVNGPAAGAGLSLAMACDLRIASDTARFGTAFAKVGFSGDYGGTWLIAQLLGPAKARELYFLADVINAQEALRIGLVNRVVPAASFAEEVDKLASRVASGPRVAYGYIKANLNLSLRAELRTILDREAITMNLTARTQDHREAVKAFLEKREPKFQGR